MGNERNLVKFHKWTEARRRCFYRIEDARNENIPSIYEYRGLALRKSPMMRYLQGLFAIIFCFTCAVKNHLFGHFIVDSFIVESSLSMLILLFGYRLAQMARDNEVGIYDKRFRRKIFYPLLISRGLPLVCAYIFYFVAATLLGKFSASAYRFGQMFLEGAFAEVALIGVIMLEFLVIFPFLWKFLYSRDKHQVNSRMWTLVVLYIAYEIVLGLGMVPQHVHHYFFVRYLLSFSLGMILFIRRRRGFRLWESLVAGAVGILFPVGGYLLSETVPFFRSWLSSFRDMPFSAGVGTLLLFAILTPLLTRYRYFRLVEPSHSVVALPGKAYYNIIMITAIMLGLEIEISVMGKEINPQSVFIIALCVLLGILWHLIMRTKTWHHFTEGIGNTEKGLLHGIYGLKKYLYIRANRMLIRYYDKRLKVGDEE